MEQDKQVETQTLNFVLEVGEPAPAFAMEQGASFSYAESEPAIMVVVLPRAKPRRKRTRCGECTDPNCRIGPMIDEEF